MSCCRFHAAIARVVGSVLIFLLVAACIAGCQKKEEEIKGYYEGPMKPKGAVKGQQGI